MSIDTSLKQNSWLTLIGAAILVIPLYLIYYRIMKLNKNKNIFEINKSLLGPVGFIFNIIIIWYSLHLGAIVLRNFTEFVFMCLLNKTPIIYTTILMIITTILLLKGDIKAIGNWATLVILIISFTVVFSTLLSTSVLDLDNLLPMFNVNIEELIKSSYSVVTFPFAEVVLFLCLTNFFEDNVNYKKILFIPLILSSIIFLLIAFRNLTLLGPDLMHNSAFKAVTASRVISLGQTLTGFEAIIIVNFIFSGLAKLSVCVLALSKGMTYLLKTSNFKNSIVPCSLLTITLSISLYENFPQMAEFVKIYPIYAIPFQIVIPTIIWIACEIKNYKQKKLNINQPQLSLIN